LIFFITECLHESKKGRKKNTSESELGFNNDSQVFDSIEGQQYYKLESQVHECGASCSRMAIPWPGTIRES
jgi:hypothetical protein